jgi:predicted GIY-YIG superfamily endonuclease
MRKNKVCTKCKVEKSLDNFYKFKNSKDGFQSRCKVCNKKDTVDYKKVNNAKCKLYRAKYREQMKHKPTVYLLVKENYVGTTSRLKHRIYQHKHNGKFVEDFIVLASFDSRKDALDLEEFMHELGYNGKHRNNVYK